MKALLLLSVLTLPLLQSGCVVPVAPRRVAYAEPNVVVAPRARRGAVVVAPRAVVHPRVSVRYYNDHRGRYHIQNGRRIYVRY